jgi:hypothetical protein
LGGGAQTAGLPDYDYGPQAPNFLSLKLHSGLLVLNAADIHIYAKDSTGGSNIDMSRWEFVAILVRACAHDLIMMRLDLTYMYALPGICVNRRCHSGIDHLLRHHSIPQVARKASAESIHRDPR